MRGPRNRWRIWLLLGLGGLVAWQGAAYFGSQRSRTDQLINQVWLERWPRDPRDMVGHLLAIQHKDHRVGSTGRGSRWRVVTDGFVWGQQGDRVRARFPQNGRRVGFQARTWKCAGEAPRPFELCLELTGKSGDKTHSFRFYSRKDWVIRPHEDGALAAEVAWLAPSLQAALTIPEEKLVGDGDDADDLAEVLPAATP